MNTALYRFAVSLALLSFASIGILEAQTAVTGAINGSVRDPANAVVTGASVDATNTATGVSDQTLTNSAGLYRFPSVLPGVYSITVPDLYVYGNSGRNIIAGPHFTAADLSLQKAFAFTERVHLDLKWDAFNAFNHPNLANPNASVDTSTAGQITSIVDFRRRMQIGAQLTF
jgi:hypothetical protein